MKGIQEKSIRSLFTSIALVLVLRATQSSATDQRAPDLSGVATNIAVGPGYKVHFHACAIGFQIYHWNAALGTWEASTPAAILYDADGMSALSKAVIGSAAAAAALELHFRGRNDA